MTLIKVNNFYKIIAIMIIFLMIFMPISNASNWGDIINSGKEFINDGKQQNHTDAVDQSQIYGTVNQIYNFLFVFGIVLSVIVGTALGIKYMCSSIEEQAKIKETLMAYVIGCIIVFGAFAIWKMIITILGQI